MDVDQSCDNTSSAEDSAGCTQSDTGVIVETDSTILEENMELLELADSENDQGNTSELKSELIPDVSVPRLTSANRRYTLRPQKRMESTDCDEYAVSPAKKRRVSLPKNGYLETIFEYPLSTKNGSLTFMGKTKIKRSMTFNDFVTKAKVKLRKLKVKRLNRGSKLKVNKKSSNCSVEDVRSRLNCLADSDDDEWIDIKD